MSTPSAAPNDCPQPPGFRASLTTLILHEACQTAGGIAELAHLLGSPRPRVQSWLDGDDEAPPEIYQACIDIVLLHEPQAGALSGRPGAGSPR